MPIPTAILFTLALFAALLAALGWWMDPDAPAPGGWLLAKVSEGGLWTGLLLFWVGAGFLAWRGRPGSAPRGGRKSGPVER